MRPARPVQRSFLGQCVRDLFDLIGCGLLWTTLSALLILQAWVLLAGEFKLPDFLHRALQAQLAAQGLKAEYSRVSMDPAGSVLVENISLATPDNPDPLATARTLLVRLDPWKLLTGKVLITDIEGSGLNVLIPAFLSPTGRADAVLAEGQFRLHFESGRQLTFDAVSGRIAGLPVALDGSYTLPAKAPQSGKPSGLPDLKPFYTIARTLVTIGEQLRPLGEMSIRGRVAHDQLILTARAPAIDLAQLPASPLPAVIGNARNVTLRLSLPFALDGHPEAVAAIEHFEVTLPDLPTASLERLQARLTGDTLLHWNNWSALRLNVCAGELSSGPFTLFATKIEAMPPGPDQAFAINLNSRLDGEPWSVRMTGLPNDNSGAIVEIEGSPTAGLMDNLEPLVPIKPSLTTLLSLGPPPLLTIRAELGRGAMPRRVEGHLEGGGAVAYRVPIKEASADFVWQGEQLSFTNMLLRLNQSEARGSYSMNVHTREFRFLLTGHLDPPDIGGWFKNWWDKFWADFSFPTPAEAQVEVAGVWGNPYLTTVFVAAEAEKPSLRQQPLDYLRTRLFIRPGWYDALDFYARDADGAAADGRFGLNMDLDGKAWRSLDFDFDSTLPKAALGRLLGPRAVEIFEPYAFSAPPHLRIKGSATATGQRDITLQASTDQPFSFHDYALQDLNLRGRMVDDVLTLDPMEAHFADGLLTGRAVVSGPEQRRWLALEHQLKNARLDTVLDILAAREKALNPTLHPTTTAPRRPGGLLSLDLRANGPLDQPTRLQGEGTASVTDAHFANISLLGKLSEIMKSTGLGFTSLSLENLTTSYRMTEGKINFPDLRLSGPSAAVEASGHYLIDDQTLDFRAKLFPYESSTGFIANTADFMLSPLSKALEFRLSGNLEKPDWTFSYGPRGLLRALTGEGQPPKPEKTDSEEVKP